MWPETKIEAELAEIGIGLIAGVDEVGRGSGAAMLSMSAVILPINHHIDLKYLRDSKKMRPRAREKGSELIHERALDLCSVDIPEKYIDNKGITEATKEGLRLLIKGMKLKPDIILMDGRDLSFETYDIPYMCLINGEDRSLNIAAASVIAKVRRDEMMKNFYHLNWPQYEFDKNKGYLTPEHIKHIKEYGPCPCHRMTYSIKGKTIGSYKK